VTLPRWPLIVVADDCDDANCYCPPPGVASAENHRVEEEAEKSRYPMSTNNLTIASLEDALAVLRWANEPSSSMLLAERAVDVASSAEMTMASLPLLLVMRHHVTAVKPLTKPPPHRQCY
jgi:hypothetical protein